MQIYHALPDPPLAGPSTLTIGNFDGVHRGHRALLAAMIADARQQGHQAGLLTFEPHPTEVLRPQASHHYLSTVDERLAMLEALGLDFAVVHPFTREVARTPAREFMTRLRRTLNVAEIWVGPDFAMGRDREGDVPALQAMGREMGFAVHVIDPQSLGGDEVHSGRIRSNLLEGEVEVAASLLGRPYCVSGEVVAGAHRGRGIGFPTANLAVPGKRLLPANGVYATWVRIQQTDGTWGPRLPSVTNVGVRPSFDNGQRTVEAHLLDFEGDLYARRLTLEFVRRLRPEMRFDSVDALRRQIAHDVDVAGQILAEQAP